MDMIETLRGQIAQLRALKTPAERETYLEEIKAFLVSLPPGQPFEHLKAIKTLLQEIQDQTNADRTSKLAA